jgi:colanic acid biosynthesis glycosyl transferase WcaI
MRISSKIAFVNQSTGLLFKGLAENLSMEWFPSVLYTGNDLSSSKTSPNGKLVVKVLNTYDRTSVLSRILSGLMYSAKVLFKILMNKPRLVMFVSNPPFVPFIGLILKVFCGQRYVILVYDIYPDILLGLNRLSEKNIVVKLWRRINKIVYENSEAVITIGNYMAKKLEKSFNPSATSFGKVVVIHNCADPDEFRPIPKEVNPFVVKYKQTDKLTVMYSGNFGYAHSFKNIVNVAKKLISNKSLNIFLIGEGSQKNNIISEIRAASLDNVICLPYQNDSVFPKALASADVALITMASGSEELMVPSKIYCSMAVGSALIGITNRNSELAKMINDHECGIVVPPDNVEKLEKAISTFMNNQQFLKRCKDNAYNAFINYYTNRQTYSKYREIMNKLIY